MIIASAQYSRELHAERILKVEKTQVPNFVHAITADHKFLNEKNESRLHHRFSVAVQDLATQWTQSYPGRNKTAQDTMRRLQRFLLPESRP